MREVELLKRRLEREKRARQQAERIAEQKTRELYQANQELRRARDELERRVEERTAELSKTNAILKEQMAERKRAEEELRIAHEELEIRAKELQQSNALLDEKNKELESFVYTVSHDLKAPLVSLEGFASILLNDYKESLDETGQLYLARIRANVQKMGDLIQDLLELSRIGRIVHDYESVDVEGIIREVIETLETQLSGREIELSVQDNLPNITCERVRIRQVFENLIINANKFMGEENDKPKIEIGFHEKGELFEFFVKDNGIGIQKEYQEKVFEIFTRLGGAEVEGTGVGLATVKKIVETHGGKIWIDSDVGRGTTVYFTLPKTRA